MTFRRAIVAALIVNMVSPPSVFSGDIFKAFRRKSSIKNSPMVELAKAIDEIEEEIDDNGSIVVKQPDVWGEARWTAHRQQYEKQLLGEIDKFKFTINAMIRESDSAFLLNAQALSTAAATATSATGVNPFGGGDQPQIRTLVLPEIKPLAPNDPTQAINGVAIEPTLFLDQLSRYQKHLNQLRRVNEGDDTADAPGYALNLLRIPVSILPGDETRKGHGAEVSISLEPELSDELLPSTFRSLVINDLIDQLSLPVVKLSESDAWQNANKKLADLQDIEKAVEFLTRIIKAEQLVTNRTAIKLVDKFEKFFADNDESPIVQEIADNFLLAASKFGLDKPTVAALAGTLRAELSKKPKDPYVTFFKYCNEKEDLILGKLQEEKDKLKAAKALRRNANANQFATIEPRYDPWTKMSLRFHEAIKTKVVWSLYGKWQ